MFEKNIGFNEAVIFRYRTILVAEQINWFGQYKQCYIYYRTIVFNYVNGSYKCKLIEVLMTKLGFLIYYWSKQ